MGNSTGNLQEYWSVFKRYTCLMGGFIWDWVDQGMAMQSAKGTRYWGYGGDYDNNKTFSDKNFCINGLVFPDRTTHPAIVECKKVLQPVQIKMQAWDEETYVLTLAIKNEHDFIGLDNLDATVIATSCVTVTSCILLFCN
jgi:beta-galactosidase